MGPAARIARSARCALFESLSENQEQHRETNWKSILWEYFARSRMDKFGHHIQTPLWAPMAACRLKLSFRQNNLKLTRTITTTLPNISIAHHIMAKRKIEDVHGTNKAYPNAAHVLSDAHLSLASAVASGLVEFPTTSHPPAKRQRKGKAKASSTTEKRAARFRGSCPALTKERLERVRSQRQVFMTYDL